MIKGTVILDSSILVGMIEGKSDGSKKVLKKLSDLKMLEEKVKKKFAVITPMSTFQNAIWNADSKSQIKNLKKILELVEIFPDSMKYFKDNDLVTKRLLEFSKELVDLFEKKRMELR